MLMQLRIQQVKRESPVLWNCVECYTLQSHSRNSSTPCLSLLLHSPFPPPHPRSPSSASFPHPLALPFQPLPSLSTCIYSHPIPFPLPHLVPTTLQKSFSVARSRNAWKLYVGWRRWFCDERERRQSRRKGRGDETRQKRGKHA